MADYYEDEEYVPHVSMAWDPVEQGAIHLLKLAAAPSAMELYYQTLRTRNPAPLWPCEVVYLSVRLPEGPYALTLTVQPTDQLGRVLPGSVYYEQIPAGASRLVPLVWASADMAPPWVGAAIGNIPDPFDAAHYAWLRNCRVELYRRK